MDFRTENPWNSNLELHTFPTHTETGLICYTGLSKVMYGNLKYCNKLKYTLNRASLK